jgi:catechol 2,3-dioxygenase-like lactoylglutathione lyase family enzyme
VLDHLGISVSDLARSRAFYASALAPLGYTLQRELSDDKTGERVAVGFGMPGKAAFWIVPGTPASSMHLAFAAINRAAVDAFHPVALAAGGRDNGAPGERPHYHADYYGAFVLDPDGYNIEAVCHAPGG